ncbi:unnamed protein product [Urochloa humidicola]
MPGSKEESGQPPMAGGVCSPNLRTAKIAVPSISEAEMAAAAAAAGVKNRLSAKEIRWILSQKPRPPPPPYQALKRGNPELTPRPREEDDRDKRTMYTLARAFYEREERLPLMQERVRGELRSKGYVEVDDEYRKRKAEVQAVIDREWAKIVAEFRDLGLQEEESESDSDDEEEEEDV